MDPVQLAIRVLELSLMAIAAYTTLNLARSLLGLMSLPRASGSSELRISVVIPARNEEESIGECLESVIPQLGEHDELIVVNDCSTDLTELKALEKLNERCKLITLLQKPSGWSGKSWACYQGYLHSSGEVIIFLDADTRVVGNLREAVSLIREYDALSQVPRIRCRGLTCGAVEVALSSLVRMFFPYWRMDSRAWLMGAFMIWRREAYESVGTHASVRGSLVEDVELARLAIRSGMRISFFLGRVTESYWAESWGEAYEIFRRISLGSNIRGRVSLLILPALAYVALMVYLSPILVILGLSEPVVAILYLASLISYASLSSVEVRANPLSLVLAPLGLMLIGLALARAGKGRVTWRGREYSSTEQSAQQQHEYVYDVPHREYT